MMGKMKLLRIAGTRVSIDEVDQHINVPEKGAVVKVAYAGICSPVDTDESLKFCFFPGVREASFYPGYEISGTVEDLGSKVKNSTRVRVGDRVVIFPYKEMGDKAYSEYVIVPDINYLVPLPPNIASEIAAMLPSGALRAYCTTKHIVEEASRILKLKDQLNVFVSGAGSLSLWLVACLRHFFAEEQIKVVIADSSYEKLTAATEWCHCTTLLWSEELYDQHLVERVYQVCPKGIDVFVDWLSTERTVKRAVDTLNPGGVIVLGRLSGHKVDTVMKNKRLTVVTTQDGNVKDLEELVSHVASGRLEVPRLRVFPAEEAPKAYEDVGHNRLSEKAVLQFCKS